MSAVVDFVQSVVEPIVDAVGDVGQTIVNAAADVVEFVGDNIVPVAAVALAAYTGGASLEMLGGDFALEAGADAALGAGAETAAAAAGSSGLSAAEYAATAAAEDAAAGAGLGTVAADTAAAGTSGLSAADYAATVAAEDAAAGAAMTAGAEAAGLPSITSGLTQTLVDMGLPFDAATSLPSISDLAQKAAINAATQYAKTGKVDLGQIITSLAAGAAGNIAGSVAGSAFDDKLLSSIASGAAKGVTTAGLSGGDIQQAALMGAVTSGAGYLAKGTPVPQSVINAVVNSAVTGKPLDQTLLNAAISAATSSGLSAIKDSFTQTPVEVTTGDAAAAMNPPVDTAPKSGLDAVSNTLDSTSNEVAPVVAGTSDVSPSPTYNTDFTGSGIDSTGVPPEPIDTYTTPPSGGIPADPSSPAGQPSGGLPDMSNYTYAGVNGRGDGVYQNPVNGQYYDRSGNASDAPVQTIDTKEPTTPVTTPVTKPVTTPVIKPTSTATPSALPYFAPVQPTSTSQPTGLGWLTDPSKSGIFTVKKENMSNPFLEDQLPQQNILYADGGSVDPFKPISDLFDPTSKTYPQFVNARPSVLSNKKLSSSTALSHVPLKTMYPSIARGMASGGLPSKYEEATPKGHKPEFITGVTGFYANGKGTGQSDDIPALLHDGDYVMDAETVSALGDGSSKAGREVLDKFRNQVPHTSKNGGSVIPAKIADGEYVFPAAFVTSLGKGENKRGSEILDGLREKLREHKRKAPLNKIPPKAKSPLEYLKSKV